MNTANKLVALVVEDDGFQRRTVARMLRALGAREVLEARDGKEALASMLRRAPVDLVVCDLDMPEMDGMEFMRHLGQARSEAAVIISSAKERTLVASVEKMARAYGVRVLGLIEKPVTLAGLEDLIAKCDSGTQKLKRVSAGTGDPSYSLDEILCGVKQKQFAPVYQPKVALATGQILGMEALTRWQHPQHGLVSPYSFISVLELSGNINELTLLILAEAARGCRRMHERGFELTVSVNLSHVSLTDTTMADRITQIVQASGLDPRWIIFEITETAAMTQVAPALENLARLRMRGFGLSVDDYGTGFASLQQLMRVPFSELKIDQGFVTGCAANPASRIIVESSVEMARNLGMKSVAEGVESQTDWDVVRAAHCDIAQGYFIARPMDESLFVEFCATKVRTAGTCSLTVNSDLERRLSGTNP
jgi:EAL domain-containing protein (putative c-di-GMP-specific phosphodiesterase class I)/AmiR/NasT family two-component response regulator